MLLASWLWCLFIKVVGVGVSLLLLFCHCLQQHTFLWLRLSNSAPRRRRSLVVVVGGGVAAFSENLSLYLAYHAYNHHGATTPIAEWSCFVIGCVAVISRLAVTPIKTNTSFCSSISTSHRNKQISIWKSFITIIFATSARFEQLVYVFVGQHFGWDIYSPIVS